MSTSGVPQQKVAARVALLDIDENASAILRDCFRQFGINSVALAPDEFQRLQKEKFEACVVRLNPGAPAVLEAIRHSPSNSRLVMYAISDSLQQALSFSRFGINAMLDHPLERAKALKAVRATYLLVVHELRRYVRLPLLTEVKIESDNSRYSGNTLEISAGGMSVATTARLQFGDPAQLTFDMPNSRTVVTRANVCWVRGDHSRLGFRFDAQDERRLTVKEWIEAYLEID